MVYGKLAAAVEGGAPDRLHFVASAIGAAFTAGGITVEEYERLDGLLAARRRVAQAIPPGARPLSAAIAVPAPAAAPSPAEGGGTASPPQRRAGVGSRPRTPDSMARRRRWASAGYLPPKLAQAFTPGEQAVIAVVGRQVATRGTCTLALGNIAALAGVSLTTAKRALRQAALVGLITIETRRVSYWRNDTNVIRIAGRDWVAWLKLRLPRAAAPTLREGANLGMPRLSAGFLSTCAGSRNTRPLPFPRPARAARA